MPAKKLSGAKTGAKAKGRKPKGESQNVIVMAKSENAAKKWRQSQSYLRGLHRCRHSPQTKAGNCL